MLFQDLQQRIRQLRHLFKIGDKFDWLVVYAPELANEHGFSRVFIGLASPRDGGVNVHGLHIVHNLDLNSSVDYHHSHFFCV